MLEELKKVFGSRSKILEMLALKHGLKPLVRHGFYDREMGRVRDFCRKHNLAIEISPYKVVIADSDKKYSNKGFKVRVEDPRSGMYFAYISKDPRKAVEARVYEMKDDHRRLGLLLGYPSCCVDFFVKHESSRSKLDNNYVICSLENSSGNKFSFYNNNLKRANDVVLISHFPCSFNCEKSADIGRRNFRLLGEIDPTLAKRYQDELKCRVKIGKKEVQFV